MNEQARATVAAGKDRLLPTLIYVALSTAVIGSLGLLLIPTIARELHVSVGTAQWVLTINLLVGAIATPIVGRLTSGAHTKRLLLIVLTAILLGSVLAATASSFPQLLVGRALQGLSFTIVPIAVTILRRHATPAAVPRGIAALSVTAATGVGIGYPLTGIIAASFDYRFAFWFAAVFVAVAIALTIIIVPAHNGPVPARPVFDYPGAILLGLGLAGVLLGVSQGESWGWGSVATIVALAAGAILLAVWVRVELRSAHPLIRLDVLRNSDVLVANATALGLGVSMYIGLSVISIVAQSPTVSGYGLGLPLFWAGFVMVPLSVGSQLSNRIAHALTSRVPTVLLLPIGAGFVTASNAFLLFRHTSVWEVLVGMLLFGMGIGLTFAAMPGLISRAVAVQELGSAVSFNQVLRTLGGAIGSAIAGAILTAHLGAHLQPTATGINLAFGVSAAACALVFVSLVGHSHHSHRQNHRKGPTV